MKKKLSAVLVLSVCLCFAVAASSLSAPAATVNLIRNKAITVQDLNKEIAAYEKAGIQMSALDILQSMVNTEVFLQGAERDGVTVSDRQLDVLYNQVFQNAVQQAAQSGYTLSQEEFEKEVIAQMGSIAEYKETIRKQQIIQTYLMQEKGEEISSNIAPTEAEIKSFYRQNQQQFFQPECVKLAHIFIPTFATTTPDNLEEVAQVQELNAAAYGRAVEADEKIKSGELTFEKAVSIYSQDTGSNGRGGDIGWLTMNNTEARIGWGDEFCDTVLSMDDGEVSGVLQSYMGFHIVKVYVHLDAKILALTDPISPEDTMTIHDYIAQVLANQKMQVNMNAALQDLTAELRGEAKIRILYKGN